MNKELQNLLLENRGIIEPEEKEKFLNPSYDKDIYDPYLMKNMEKAVVRIFEAIEAKEKIIIYSDVQKTNISKKLNLLFFGSDRIQLVIIIYESVMGVRFKNKIPMPGNFYKVE